MTTGRLGCSTWMESVWPVSHGATDRAIGAWCAALPGTRRTKLAICSPVASTARPSAGTSTSLPCCKRSDTLHTYTSLTRPIHVNTFVSATPAVDFKEHIHVVCDKTQFFIPVGVYSHCPAVIIPSHLLTSVENSISWIFCISSPALSALRSYSVVNFLPVWLPHFYVCMNPARLGHCRNIRSRPAAVTFTLVVFLLCNVFCTDDFLFYDSILDFFFFVLYRVLLCFL